MKNIVWPLLLLTLISACGNSEEKEERLSVDLIENNNTGEDGVKNSDDNAPFFEFVEEVKDFGQITQGEIITTVFRFRNVGKSDLIISSAQGSCGCTVPEWPKEPIKSGENGEVTVTFDSNGKFGVQNKTITLVANTIPNTKVIALKGEVLAPSK
ncbi:MAG: DUF1573 domain-containing protein [Vicingaceae bacterium]|nr:DUF1573 domain-containing protein [Vicingaceae bacterium]